MPTPMLKTASRFSLQDLAALPDMAPRRAKASGPRADRYKWRYIRYMSLQMAEHKNG